MSSVGILERRPIAPGRDPCPKCETRGDLGCDHFAPCEEPRAPAQQPGEFRQYNTTLDGPTRSAIAAARRNGKTYREIADEFQVSRGAVANIVLAAGLRVRMARTR
jgi:DNA-directed RNA polymerase specialized sigma24 family protein